MPSPRGTHVFEVPSIFRCTENERMDVDYCHYRFCTRLLAKGLNYNIGDGNDVRNIDHPAIFMAGFGTYVYQPPRLHAPIHDPKKEHVVWIARDPSLLGIVIPKDDAGNYVDARGAICDKFHDLGGPLLLPHTKDESLLCRSNRSASALSFGEALLELDFDVVHFVKWGMHADPSTFRDLDNFAVKSSIDLNNNGQLLGERPNTFDIAVEYEDRETLLLMWNYNVGHSVDGKPIAMGQNPAPLQTYPQAGGLFYQDAGALQTRSAVRNSPDITKLTAYLKQDHLNRAYAGIDFVIPRHIGSARRKAFSLSKFLDELADDDDMRIHACGIRIEVRARALTMRDAVRSVRAQNILDLVYV